MLSTTILQLQSSTYSCILVASVARAVQESYTGTAESRSHFIADQKKKRTIVLITIIVGAFQEDGKEEDVTTVVEIQTTIKRRTPELTDKEKSLVLLFVKLFAATKKKKEGKGIGISL